MPHSNSLWSPKNQKIWLALLLVGIVGVFPYLPVLDYWPWSSDSLKWYSKSNLNNPNWIDWAFGHRHFIGYRPIAALSLTINSAIGGPFPQLYRLTDLLLFLGTGFAVFGLWATLTRRVDGWGLLAAGLFFSHPSAQDIIPFLARRTYLLALFFGTVSLICFNRHLNSNRTERRWIFASCICLALALFSNEFSYLTVGFMVLLCCTSASKITLDTLRPALPIIGVTLVSLALRWSVLGHFGGYQVAYFAKIRRGERVTTLGAEFWEVFQASLLYTFFPSGISGGSHWVYGGVLGTGVVLTYYCWRSLVRPLRNWEQPNERLKLWLLLWLVSFSLLYGFSNTWFWRQGFPMVIPMALLVSLVARDTMRDFHHERSLLGLNYIPQLVLVMSMLFYSPQLRGKIDAEFGEVRDRRNQILNELIATTSDFGPEMTVYLALPILKKDSNAIDFWARTAHSGPAPRYLNLGYATEKTTKKIGESSATLDQTKRQIHLHLKLELSSMATSRLGLRAGAPLSLADGPSSSALFYVEDGVGKAVYIEPKAELPPGKQATNGGSPEAKGKGKGKGKGKNKGKDKRKGAKKAKHNAPSLTDDDLETDPTEDDKAEAPTVPKAQSTTEAHTPRPVDAPAEP